VNNSATASKELEALLNSRRDQGTASARRLADAHPQVRFLYMPFRERGEVPAVEAEEERTGATRLVLGPLVAAPRFPDLLISGQTESTYEALDAQQKRGISAKKIWGALRRLNDYCPAKPPRRQFIGTSDYRDHTPSGGIPAVGGLRGDRSQPTNERRPSQGDPHSRANQL